MTKYVIDGARQEIIAKWETGIGGRARLVTRLPDAISPDPNLPPGAAIADRLGRPSEAAWCRYTGGDFDADNVDSCGEPGLRFEPWFGTHLAWMSVQTATGPPVASGPSITMKRSQPARREADHDVADGLGRLQRS